MTYWKRKRNLFEPKSKRPFELSRSKLEMFLDCPRCFYLDRRLGLKRPSMPGFALNIAVDELLKKEFDIHRAKGEAHCLMKQYGIKAVPFEHPDLDKWRNNFVGVRFWHRPSNFLVFGAVDDVWQKDDSKLIVVDYKATSTREEITLDSKYRQAYKRQMEIYQWLLKQNGFDVAEVGYFVYANGDKDKQAFDNKLEFEVQLIKYRGNDDWVESALIEARECLKRNRIPGPAKECEYCAYRGLTTAAITKRQTRN